MLHDGPEGRTEMNAFQKNMSSLFADWNETQRSMAKKVGVTSGTVSNWLNKGMIPNMETLTEIMDIYGVSYDDLMSEDLGYYKKSHGGYNPNALAPSEPQPAYAPLYGTVHAGDTNEPELIDDRIPIPFEVYQNHKHGYFLRVIGDCMDKVYPEGCFVFVDPDMQPRSGSIGIVAIDCDDYIMRRLYRGASTLVLTPESHNPKWEDTIIDSTHEVKLVGTVVWFQSAEEMS